MFEIKSVPVILTLLLEHFSKLSFYFFVFVFVLFKKFDFWVDDISEASSESEFCHWLAEHKLFFVGVTLIETKFRWFEPWYYCLLYVWCKVTMGPKIRYIGWILPSDSRYRNKITSLFLFCCLDLKLLKMWMPYLERLVNFVSFYFIIIICNQNGNITITKMYISYFLKTIMSNKSLKCKI